MIYKKSCSLKNRDDLYGTLEFGLGTVARILDSHYSVMFKSMVAQFYLQFFVFKILQAVVAPNQKMRIDGIIIICFYALINST